MIIYPAIDIKDSKCVRLTQGKFDNITIYGDDPVETAKKWEALGGVYLHTVDLDGARGKGQNNRDIIKEIAKTLKIPVQTGGGIRSLSDIEELISGGISRVILGTAALQNEDFLISAVKEYGEKIAVSIDAKDGYVAVSGWEEISDVEAVDFAKRVEKMGVKTIIYTDIATDGMLTGPNLEAMKLMASSVKMSVIASGGIGRKEDILSLKPTGVGGVIVGKALYAGKVNPQEVLKGC